MKIYHATSKEGKAGIEAIGFARSHLPDRPGRSSFSRCRELTGTAHDHDWIVIVEIPEELATPDPDYPADFGVYLIEWDVVNACRPFEFKPIAH